jgi:hypothetical protein
MRKSAGGFQNPPKLTKREGPIRDFAKHAHKVRSIKGRLSIG